MQRIFTLSFLLVCLSGYLFAQGVQRGADQRFGESYRPGILVIKFKESAVASFRFSTGTDGIVTTGVSSLDALNVRMRATSISRDGMYEPQNRLLSQQLGADRIFLLRVPSSSDMKAVAAMYAADPNVEFANPDWQVYPAVVPNDPLHSSHWGHNNTAQMPSYNWASGQHNGPNVGTVGFDANAQTAWDQSQVYGSTSVLIAIIDGGVNWAHPDLRIWANDDPVDGLDNDGNGKIDDIRGWDFGNDDNNPNDDASGAGHGTACSGVAAAIANNAAGVAGIAGGCTIMPLKAANSAGTLFYTSINDAIYYAADNGADVISMSLGSSGQDGANQTACTYAWNAGVVVLAATGNENNTAISYPAGNTDVIAVGAASNCGDRKRSSSNSGEVNPGVFTDPNGYTCDGERWWGSNYGTNTQDAATAVDVIAPTILPTTDIVGSGGYSTGSYSSYFNGTSCSTPYAAGLCALIISQNPSWTPAQVRNQLCMTAQDIVNIEAGAGWDRYNGYGMVDAYAALTSAGASIAVSIPNGGETWGIGSAQNIQWTSNLVAGNVRIEISRDGGVTFSETAFASTANDGVQSWTVTGPASSSVSVRIFSVTTPSICDTSDANFTLVQPTITVLSPDGGETWGVGASNTIQWTSSNLSGSVKIDILRGNSLTTLFAATPNDGNQSWTVAGPVSDSARIRISSFVIPSVADTSNGYFSIVQPSLSIVTPNGGESWLTGSSQSITWTSSGLSGNVTLLLSRNGGTTYPETLFANTTNDGSESWTVTGPGITTARVKVVSTSLPSVADTSETDFAIGVPSLFVDSPDGGEELEIDSTATLQWSSLLTSGNVMIELSRDGGATYETLFASTADDGAEGWTVSGPSTSQARLRITNISDPLVVDSSAALFAIGRKLHIAAGFEWNMVSVPVTLEDMRKTVVFPAAVSQGFGFEASGYVAKDTLVNGAGYWLKFPSAQNLSLFGGERTVDTIIVQPGWNMIGSITAAVPVDSIIQQPTGIVVSAYYGYNSAAYSVADTLFPMKAFWVKTSQAGALIVKEPVGPLPPKAR